MKLVALRPDELSLSDELRRSGSSKQFEDRLRASIEEIGLAEPLKVAHLPTGNYLVVDGTMRLRAIQAIRQDYPERFETVPAYLTDYERRFEIRYQTDIYQDLLPSQLASLVEHLHQSARVKKTDIARYLGVSPATLRNYTGLWRLVQRGGLFARIVELMDAEVFPASNPYAWLRLTAGGLEHVLTQSFCENGETPDEWIDRMIVAARHGSVQRVPTAVVESATGDLNPEHYREVEDLRLVKKDLGLRRAMNLTLPEMPEPKAPEPEIAEPAQYGPAAPAKAQPRRSTVAARRHLSRVARESPELVLQAAARSLAEYLT
ncbi:ParB N-terminal domain-containing protein [Micromonospora sp. H61]|uniref:ParB N-terminal domain-containing protein n=1 Tax=Micromonospora sp. H61 TaxID=2824888 RepID=UPI001B360E59|nr:ParB N-terminal domain-containing protein [Micromonospora sp. H61]MBQ0991282.1 ParB N-terminal domain-containing protein [Micromonospora sp. H61]